MLNFRCLFLGLTCFSCWFINVIRCLFFHSFEVMFILVITGADRKLVEGEGW